MTTIQLSVVEGDGGLFQIRLFSGDAAGVISTARERMLMKAIAAALDVLITEALKETGVPFEMVERDEVVEKMVKALRSRKWSEGGR